MASATYDREWLQAGIATALSWDVFVVEGVVDAIEAAGSQRELDELLADFLGGDTTVCSLVAQYISHRDRLPGSATSSSAANESITRARHGNQEVRGPAAAATGPAKPAMSGGSGLSATSGRNLQDLHVHEEAPELIDGIQVKRSGKRSKGVPRPAPRPQLEKPVVNCLACGKVYDCRLVTNDVITFLESDGVCTFCGARVALHSGQRSEMHCPAPAPEPVPPPTPSQGKEGSALMGSETLGESQGDSSTATGHPADSAALDDDASRAAVAFKDRLVEYDRNAAKRTAVIDDQSDFFEIDSNAWLTPAERAQLKSREKAIQEAEAARRKRVVVTFDLLGRQVVMAEDGPEDPAMQAVARAAQLASTATAAEKPQGGGTAATLALQLAEQLAPWRGGATEGIMPQRIAPCPDLPRPAPMFVRPAPRPAPTSKSVGSAATGKAAVQSRDTTAGSRPQVAKSAVGSLGQSSGQNLTAAAAESGARPLPAAHQRPEGGSGRGAGRGAVLSKGGRGPAGRFAAEVAVREIGDAAQVASRAATQAMRGIRENAVSASVKPLVSSARPFQPRKNSAAGEAAGKAGGTKAEQQL